MTPQPSVDVIILTRGNRPRELERAVDSARGQTGVTVSVIVVGNGWQPTGLPAAVRTVHLPDNVGVGGRNFGVPLGQGELLFFLDDDAWLPEPDTLARVAAVFAADPEVGMIQTRLADPATPRPPILGTAPAQRRPAALQHGDVRAGGRGGDQAHGVRASGRLGGQLPVRP